MTTWGSMGHLEAIAARRDAEDEAWRKQSSLAARFWQRVAPAGDCLEWVGVRNRDGYGTLTIDHRLRLAHRIAWELTHGPIPKGMYVLHTCDNPPCVNPDHLWIGTQAQNLADMRAKGRWSNGRQARTHCRRGHPYTDENTRHYGTSRRCRTCERLQAKRPARDVA